MPWNAGLRKVYRWNRPEWVPVDPSDRRTKHTFSAGQCHSLAFALNKLTGWPLVLLSQDEDDPRQWEHCVVQAPDGRFVDIDGAWELGESSWDDLSPIEIGTCPKDVLYYIRGSMDEVNVPKALPFAKAVLAMHFDSALDEVLLPA